MMLRNSVNFSLLQISSQLRNCIFTKTQRKESISLKFLLVVLKSFLCFCYIAHLTMSIFTIKTVSCGHEFLTVSNLTEKQKFVMAAEYGLKYLAISKSLSCFFSCNALRKIYHNKGLFALSFHLLKKFRQSLKKLLCQDATMQFNDLFLL